jgi:hypothetical protein
MAGIQQWHAGSIRPRQISAPARYRLFDGPRNLMKLGVMCATAQTSTIDCRNLRKVALGKTLPPGFASVIGIASTAIFLPGDWFHEYQERLRAADRSIDRGQSTDRDFAAARSSAFSELLRAGRF